VRRGKHLAAVLAVAAMVSCAPRPSPRTTPATPEPIVSAALTAHPEDGYTRVVDVGSGLCVVIRAPGDHFMVYDAGHGGQHCISAVTELVNTQTIDLSRNSHSDADHLGDAARILEESAVQLTLLAGAPRGTAVWNRLITALAAEVTEGGSVHNLQSVPLVPGRTIPLGEATVTLIAGWKEWTGAGPTASERRNAISVVVRLDRPGM
jgi:beta-lactamase superfamily II metal-dependent hydrolase